MASDPLRQNAGAVFSAVAESQLPCKNIDFSCCKWYLFLWKEPAMLSGSSRIIRRNHHESYQEVHC